MQAGNRVGGLINEETADTFELQAAVSGLAIRVTDYVLGVDGATNLTFLSAATPLSGVMPLSAASTIPFASGHAPDGHFQTAPGEALNLTSSAIVDLDGHWTGILV
jgi:hypothetical protein